MKLSFFLPYAVLAVLHLVFCAGNKQFLRHLTKTLLVPLLLLGYACTAKTASPFVLAALLLGWAGDIFLIWPDSPKLRTAGIAAFGAGHVLYILAMLLPLAAAPELTWLCVLAPVAAAAGLYVFSLRVMDRALRVPGALYYLLLAALCAAAAVSLAAGTEGAPWLLAGAAGFLISDTLLVRQFSTVGDPAPKFDFFVMLTYILAQGFLALGFAMR